MLAATITKKAPILAAAFGPGVAHLNLAPGEAQAATRDAATWNSLFSPSGTDYVGLFAPQGSTPLSRIYTNGTASPGDQSVPAGTAIPPIPASLPTGRYDVRLVSGPSNGLLARADLTVALLPVAVADTHVVAAGRTLNVPAPGLLANDTDGDSPTLKATVETRPTHGALVLQENGAFTYTPTAGYSGSDSFTYRATDESSQSATGTVTITVPPVACAPRPTANVITSVANGALQVTVSVSDVDGPTQNRLKELRFGAPVNGRIELAGQSQTAAFTHVVPNVTDRVSFEVRRVSPGQPTTVPLTVVDECGAWPTLVGGGTGAGF